MPLVTWLSPHQAGCDHKEVKKESLTTSNHLFVKTWTPASFQNSSTQVFQTLSLQSLSSRPAPYLTCSNLLPNSSNSQSTWQAPTNSHCLFLFTTGVEIVSFKFLLAADKEGRSMLMLFQGPRPRPGTILVFNKRSSICRQSRDVWCGWPPNAEMSEVSRSARHWMMSGAAPWKPMPIPDLSPA